ncbi:class I SAM-dependent methyltransferase [Rhodobacteraceae bacterium nBUS_22]
MSVFSDLDIAKTIETWQSERTPREQWKIVSQQIQRLKQNIETAEFKSFREALETSYKTNDCFGVLEVGCSSGYYSEVLNRSFPNSSYTGVDFSKQFVEFGAAKFPNINLQQMDAEDLGEFADRQFDCVVSGCVLLHIPNWKNALIESARVANRSLILHRTPLSDTNTQRYIKSAYGSPTLEWQFSINDINEQLAGVSFRLKQVIPLSASDKGQVATIIYERIL